MRRQQATATSVKRSWRWDRIGGLILVVIICIATVFWYTSRSQGAESSQAEVMQRPTVRSGFAVIEATNLSDTQRQVLTLVQQEYQKDPTSYDSTVMKYTEGFEESWCADFISWVFNQAGTPFVHPDTKYWRIPGVQTLKAYYEQENAYHEVGDEYKPQFGDVAFYFGETPDGGSAEHVAMVLEVRGDILVTIGGNEGSGILQVRYDTLKKDVKGLTAIGESGIGV